MKKLLILSAILVLAFGSTSQAIPDLQVWIDGATYDESTQTWVTGATTFDLYIIGTAGLTDVKVSMALGDYAEFDDPNAAGVSVSGVGAYNPWVWGYAPSTFFPDTWDGGSSDLAKHGIFPAWFTEFNAGDFADMGGLGNTNQDDANLNSEPFWFPTDGYIGSSNHRGEFKKFTITLSNTGAVHFDAYTLLSSGKIDKFAPFSHDAEAVPEPTTAILFGLGMGGAALVRRFRSKK